MGDAATGGELGGAAVLSGVPKGLAPSVAAGVGGVPAVGAAVMFGAAVAVAGVVPVVVVLVTPILISALKRGAVTP